MRPVKKFFFLILFTLLSLTSICLFRVFVYFQTPKDVDICAKSDITSLNENERNKIIQRFSDALKIPTVTTGPYKYDAQQMLNFHRFLEKSFPVFHSSPLVKRELIANYSLLYKVQGSDTKLRPYMLCSHIDVVPVEREKWTVNPFEGFVRDGHIYGRGTVDVKDTLMAMLEALEYSLKKGFKPRRSFYLAFGHDEEASGFEGAQAIAKTLQSRNVKLEYLLDEGSFLLDKVFPGIDHLVALVSVAEKGFLTLQLEATGKTGHSSMPTGETAIVTLSKALSKLHAHIHPSRFGLGPEKSIIESLAPYVSFPYKFFFGNLWLFGKLISSVMSTNELGNALVRTTTAVTMINGGLKENILPSIATALVNHRIHPADSVESVIQFNRELIADENIKISIYKGVAFEPHPISPYNSTAVGFHAIKNSIQKVFAKTVVAPGIMIAGTDTKWYLNLTESIYRFSPVIMRKDTLKLFHGHDERISVDNYLKIVDFYYHLIETSDNLEEFAKQIPLKDEL